MKFKLKMCSASIPSHVALRNLRNETIFARMSIVISNLIRLSLRKLVRRFEFPILSEEFCEMGQNMTINAINTTINSSHFAHESGKSDRSIFAIQNVEMERFSGVSSTSAAFNPFHFAHLSGTKKPPAGTGGQ